jgi:hypothetical protein
MGKVRTERAIPPGCAQNGFLVLLSVRVCVRLRTCAFTPERTLSIEIIIFEGKKHENGRSGLGTLVGIRACTEMPEISNGMGQ